MSGLTDHELLVEFTRSESESAFATLVARYVNLVYSTALRYTGNSHHSQEITQAVFIILARKARGLSSRVVLSGWLYQTARLAAANFVKGEMRRQRREQEAYMQSTLNESDTDAWKQIAPLLDEAMGHLCETDRNAVVLRFFENKTSAEVAAVLNTTEAAAHKRVSRALEKLRGIFGKRGITLTAATIAVAVSTNSVHAAPAAIGPAISAAASQGFAVAASTMTLVKGTMKIMTWLKLKFAAGVATVLIATGGTLSVAVLVAADASSAPPDQKAVTRLIQAVQKNDYNQFMADADVGFKSLTKQNLESVSTQLGARLKGGYETKFLGELKQHGYRVTLWKLTFSDGGDDVLAKLSTKDGLVSGFLLQ